ncbi:hypothetical protein [Natrinema sp. SYSU A 869]|uniref:hypothetical protein n=1 Tax=Natrinema sp. SYSU A 869 TaxID=2871694 RepID=UPI001CA3965B|nr:hypothetical protein [Natrinema sp. SYSU A 869]
MGESSGGTQWFVDGELNGRSLGPWYSAYYSHQGAECWYQTFESEGTYEVAAVVDGDNKDSRATWMVHVSPDGAAAPSIEKAQPADKSLEIGRDEETDLELTVTDPNGDLDRVVWWLGHADDILDVTDVCGSEDTASLSLERVCDRCPIIVWVIGEDRSITQERLWMINEATE